MTKDITEIQDGNTLYLVHDSLKKAGLSWGQTRTAIECMQEAGIVFVEISHGSRPPTPDTKMKRGTK